MCVIEHLMSCVVVTQVEMGGGKEAGRSAAIKLLVLTHLIVKF